MSFLSYLINGISLGSVYAIIALGYTMVYGIARMLNFAHGDIIMVGGFTVFTIVTTMGGSPVVGIRITNCKTGEIIFSRSLPQEANQKIIRLAEEEQVGLLSYDEAGAKLLTNQSDSPYAKLEARINGMELVQVDDIEAAITYPVPKYLMMEDGDYLAMVEPRVKAAMGKNFSVYRSEPFFLEVLPRGIDKAQSLERLLSHIGLSREQMIACGDGYNDLTMIQYAGLGVAMENAVLPVRKAADFITYSNNDDGVAHVVEKFML